MKIFILMYNFPPIGAGRGIAWSYFAKELSEYHNVTIFTINPNENDPLYNKSKWNLISERYRVIRSDPGKFYKKSYVEKKNLSEKEEINKSKFKSKIRKFYHKYIKFFVFPDRMIFWNKYLTESVIDEVRVNGSPDLIISVGFPFSTHFAAVKLKNLYESKLVLDYGDPWSFNPSNETIPKRRKFIDLFFEKKILMNADYVTVTTKQTREKYLKTFPFLDNKIQVITQGVDTSIYSQKDDKVYEKKTNEIHFFYSGLFYEDIRNPLSFIDAIEEMTKIELRNRNIIITIAGKMEEYVLSKIESLQNKNITYRLLGNITLDEVVFYQKKCDCLLFFGNLGSLQLPGKIFEYLATDRPIFAICDLEDMSIDLINQYKRGTIASYNKKNIKDNFVDFLNRYSEGSYDDLIPVKEFDWSSLSQKYKNIITSLGENL